MRRLEQEVAPARVGQAELRHRLQLFEMIAGAAGATLAAEPWWGATVPAAPMPASLAAAARDERSLETPVRLDVGDADVIAVIGGPGDPREWWSAVWQIASADR